MQRAVNALGVIGKFSRIDDMPTLSSLIDDLNSRIDQIKEDEHYYSLPKEARDKMKLAALGNRNLWKPELDPKYQKAKELRECGMKLNEACMKAGITTDQWYRRQAIEKYGKARAGGKRRQNA
jgi:hypothetical protein